MADVSPLVTKLTQLTKAGLDEHEKRIRKYDDLYDVYRAPSKPSTDWHSQIKAKYGMQVIDTALVNIVSGKPRCIVKPRTPADEQSAKAMQFVLDYHIDQDHFVEKQAPFVQQALVYGTTVAKNHWQYQTCTRQLRVPGGTYETGKVLVPQTHTYVEKDGPTFEPWDIYHAWWDPDGRDVDSCRYVVLRSYMSKDEILRLESKDDKGVFTNVQALFDSGSRNGLNETSQQRFNASEKQRDKFELWEIWHETPTGLRVTVIGNGSVVLRDEPTPYDHGKKPLVITQTRPDMFDIAGIAETELVDHLQQALWTVQNARFDNLNLTVNKGITYREGGVADPSALKLRPGFVWPVQDHDDVKPFEIGALPPEVYHEEESLLSRLQLITGINPYVTGSDQAGVDQNTATGVTVLNEVASRLLRFKASQIHYKGHQRTYEQWAEMVQQLQDRKVVIRIDEASGYNWHEVQPEEIIGNFDITLEGSEESLSRQQERSEAIGMLNVFAPLIQAGLVDGKLIIEKVGAAFGFTNPEALYPKQGPVAAPNASPGPPPGNGPPQAGLPSQALMPDQNGNGTQLDPRILTAVGQ